MDNLPDLSLYGDTPPAPPPLRGRAGGVSGWLIGMIVGVLAGLWMITPVRYTLGSQLRFAVSQDSLPWLRTLDSQHSLREASRLDAAAALLPDDYLLQVGRATALVEAGGVRPFLTPTVGHADDIQDVSDHTLVRLSGVARDFLLAPGAQAHLARYMMVDRVRIQRAELAPSSHSPASTPHPASAKISSEANAELPPRTIPARYTDVKLMSWALRNGERADPGNAFWPAMQAAACFAAGRDREALDALAQAAQKTRWDSYLYEEVLGQWRLYSLAYGDHGAAQQIGPLSLIAFPHLRELRRMAEMARWHADRAAQNGNAARAIQIRRSIRLLGHILRDNAAWAYEALYGTDLLLISACDGDTMPQQSAIRTVRDWEQQGQRYLAFLRQEGKQSEVTVLYAEVEESCRLRKQVDIARADASYPGIPPGIPLVALFGDWMTGVCLLQQALLLCGCMGIVIAWKQARSRMPLLRPLYRLLSCQGALGVTLSLGMLVFTSLPSSRLAALFFCGACLLFVLICASLQRRRFRRVSERLKRAPERFEAEGSMNNGSDGGGSFASPRVLLRHPFPRQEKRVEERWKAGTTLRFLFVLLTPGLLLLYAFRSLLSSLHPVALLLTNMIGIEPDASGLHALQVGLLACAFPVALITCLCLWGLWRRVAVLTAVEVGLRRMFLPALACLAFAYLLLLSQTLRLDAEATHAINEAAKDDLHWVLTHSEEE